MWAFLKMPRIIGVFFTDMMPFVTDMAVSAVNSNLK
jgi:hypothetical protein